MQVFKRIFLLDGVNYDSNVYLIDDELIVDTGTGLFFKELKEEMENAGFNLEKFKMIINTHCHFDHIGGNKKFRDWLKLNIAAHENDKKSIETGNGTLAHLFGEKPRVSTVDYVLGDGNIIETEHFTFHVISTPGHTPGSICLYEPEKKLLFSGDTVFADGVGRTDLTGGDPSAMVQTLKRLSRLSINALLPGHGEPKYSGVVFFIRQMANKINSTRKFA